MKLEAEGSLVKSAVCVTVDRKILKWISSKIERKVFASRSHAIEYAVTQLMENDRQTQVRMHIRQ